MKRHTIMSRIPPAGFKPGTSYPMQTVWIQIRPLVLSGLIWVQTVCIGYQQTTKVDTSEERVNSLIKALTTLVGRLFLSVGWEMVLTVSFSP